MKGKSFENSTLALLIEEGSTVSPRINLREKIKIEFYKTYDVMTGIRIAATLGGFFSMMIILVLYKNYCKPNKTLSEEQLNAAVTAAAEEEDRALQAALEATSFYTALEKRRESLRNTNQVLLPPRFSSVGGGYSHLAPPLKVMQQRGKSLPGSVMHFVLNSSPMPSQKNQKTDCSAKEEDSDFYGEQLDYFACRNHLNVPPSRRVSSSTCSSADSAYLERCSAFELGLPSPSQAIRHSREKLQEKKDFYYPIDIQVIQPTPEMSPTASERNLNEEQIGCLKVPAFHDQMHRLSVTSFDFGLAPLASISSLGSFSSQSLSPADKSFLIDSIHSADKQGCSCTNDSLGSDSVFMDIEDEEFPTDSEFECDGFDDDYSFCETKQKPISTEEARALRFASFDSFDASITQDSNSEITEEDTPNTKQFENNQFFQFSRRPLLVDFKRRTSLHDGNKIRKKLVKTYSEPKSSKVKRLPAWVEKGKSSYIPKVQLPSPSARKKKLFEEDSSTQNQNEPTNKNNNIECKGVIAPSTETSQNDGNVEDLTKLLLPLPLSSSSNDNITFNSSNWKSEKSGILMKQGIIKELPLKNVQNLSLSIAQEKRSRLKKQKNFTEEVNESFVTNEKTEAQKITKAEKTVLSEPVKCLDIVEKKNGEFSRGCEPTEETNSGAVSSDIQFNEDGRSAED